MLIHGCECTFDFAFAAGANHKHFHPERMGSRLRRSQFDATVRVVWIHEISEGSDLRHQLVQQLQSLSYGGRPKYGDTGDIAARLIEARDQALPNGIVVGGEHYGDRLSCRLGNLWRRFTTSC